MGFAANIQDDDYRVATMGQQALPLTELTPDGMFSNLGGAIGSSFVGGVASVGRLLGDLGSAAAKYGTATQMQELGLPPEDVQQVLAAPATPAPFDESLQKVQDWAKIDPRVTGTGSQIAGSAVHGITVAGLGTLAGGPVAGGALLGATSGYEDYRENKAAGLDETTALEKAGIAGAAGTLGALPFMGGFGGNLAAKIATGAGVNTGFGIAQRAATSSLLESAGYKDMAAQYKALDASSMVADVILGSAFGGWSHFHEGLATGKEPAPVERPSPALVESALEARRQEAIERGGPGIPTTPEHATMNTDLQDRALGDLLRGETPEVAAPEAEAMVEHTLVDPERVQLNDQYNEAGLAVHGDIADFTEPVRTPAEDVGPRWFTGSPEAGLAVTRTLEEQAGRANAEGQHAGPGHYISQDRDTAGLYGGPEGRAYEVHEPFTNAFDFNTVKDWGDGKRQAGDKFYKSLVEREGSKAKANAWLQKQGYDAITFTLNRGEKAANIFEARKLTDIGPAREPVTPMGELSLAPLEGAKPAAPAAPAAEGAKLSPLAGEQMRQLAIDHPDLEVQLPDGSTVRAADMGQSVAEQLSTAQSEASLHDIAVACFLRTL